MDFSAGGRNLLDYWSILVRRRWVIYLAVLTTTLTSLIGSFIVTPIYLATVTLQIERHSPNIFTFRDLAQADYSWAAYSDFYQTQYKIISSMTVARGAVDRLQLTSHPDFAPGEAEPGLLARLRALIPRRRGTAVEQDPQDVAAARVLAGLEVSPIRNSHLVQLSWVASDPVLAADVANALAGAFVQYTIDSQYSTTDEAEGFLVDQIGMLKQEISQIEQRLQEYGEAKRIISVDDSNNITLQALKDVAERRTEARTTLARTEAAYKATLETESIALPEVMHSELIARLRQEYAKYEADYTEQSRQFGSDWPEMQTLKSKLDQARLRLDLEIENIARQVRAAAEAAYGKAVNEVHNLEQLLATQESDAQRLKRNAVEFTNLLSEVQKKRETLNALIERQNEMALSTRLRDLDSTSTNIRIMEPARPPVAPFRPNTKVNLALGLLFGLVLGGGMAFFLDYLDNTISSVGQLEQVVDLPVLAVIPRHGPSGGGLNRVRLKGPTPAPPFDLIADVDGRAGASEAYRELRTSLMLSHPGQPPRRIIVSSALPEEGKTATTINLAIVLAQLGRRVLIVDTDQRRPRLHKPFDLENRRGVSTYLSGLEQEAGQLVLTTGVANLDLLPSGPIPPNPSELLNSTRFAEMAEELLAGGYDHLIFDSPPALSVADAVIIASVADSGILVVRAARTPRQSVRLAAEKFRQVGTIRFGLVLNDLSPEAGGSSYGRYDYYGRYGEPATNETPEGRARGASA
jgi:capsular exopolysaccharide synthesis family protein